MHKSGFLKTKSGEILIEKDEILARWKKYVKEVYRDPERTKSPFQFSAPLSDPKISNSEIEIAISKQSQTKPMSPNELSNEMIKTLEDTGVDALHTFFNKMYDPGEILSGITKSIFITLTKKNRNKRM